MRRLGLGLLLTSFSMAFSGCCTSTISGHQTGGTSASGTTTSGTTTGTGSNECPAATYDVSPGPLTPRTSLGAAFGSDGLAYIAGGTLFDGGATALVEALNPASGIVTVGPPMLTARSAFALVASPDQRTLYAIGGFGPEGSTATAESFDVPTQIWSRLPSMPHGGGPTVAGVLEDGRVVAIVPGIIGPDGGTSVEVLVDGGWQDGPEILVPSPWDGVEAAAAGPASAVRLVDSHLDVLEWDPAADAGTWKLIATHQMPGTLVDVSVAQDGKRLLAIGGIFEGFDCVEPSYLNIALDTAALDGGWFDLVPRPPLSPDKGASAVSPDARLFVFGGEQSSACCTGHSEELSRAYLGGYEILDADAGAWRTTPAQDGG
jgi:hypothetical protein